MQQQKRILKPTEGQWFEVNPKAINRKLFKKKRKGNQEQTRQLILEAFEEVEHNQDKYGKAFRTIMPEKNWELMNIEKAQILAKQFEGHVANWVEQALEWAQRINNGETWEELCNEPDEAKNYRMIIWKNNSIRMIGGSDKHNYSATDICYYNFHFDDNFLDVVPLIASYI